MAEAEEGNEEVLPPIDPFPHTFLDTNLRRSYLDTVPTASSGGVVPSGDTLPSSPTIGELFFDTANSKLYMYDGTNWRQLPLMDSNGNLFISGRYLKS